MKVKTGLSFLVFKITHMKRLLRSFVIPIAIFLSGNFLIAQTYTIGADNGINGQYEYPTPFGDFYKTQRMQHLYRASELTAAGMESGYITEIKWDVISLPAGTGATEGFTLKLLSTGVSALGLTTWESGATIVWGPTNYTPVLGANTFVLDELFFWDGSSNLIVEICGGNTAFAYTKNARVTWSGPLGFNASHTRASDLELNPCTYTGAEYWTGPPGGPTYRPRISFTRIDGTECDAAPVAEDPTSSETSVCSGESFTLSIAPIVEVGISYQWQKSTDGVAWNNIVGGISSSITTTQSVQTLYRCVITCVPMAMIDISDAVVVFQNDPGDCYCIPTYTTGTIEGDYVSHVVLEDINNTTGALPYPYYEYYDAITTDLYLDSSYTISLSVGTYITNNGVAAWIDYNHDGDFTDAGEKLGEVTAIAAYGTGNINFSIPDGAVLGTTRLRIRDVWNTIGISPCLEYGYGETEDYNVNITPGYPPIADFTYSGDPTVTFTNLTIYTTDSWFWDFGDGGTSTLENPVHLYTTNGTYEVCLTATNVLGSDTHCEDVVISTYLPPVAMFDYTGDPLVTFTDLSTEDPYEWFWEFDDGVTSTEQNPEHTYTLNGVYNVCLTSTNAVGSDTYCENVSIITYIPPAALFEFSGDPTVTFTDLSSEDPTEWFWDFGDGGTSTEQNPEYTFASNGTYYVCLTATNAVGSNTFCQYVLIDSYLFAPDPAFTYFGDPTVYFIDFSTEDPTEWFWDFGDGIGTSVEQNPSYTYLSNGTYEVCLTATNAVGSNTECQTIVIDGYPSPEGLFTYSGDPTVTFTDLSTNSPTTWFWDFDDGSFAIEQNPVHAFALNGVYTVCLTVSGAGGADTYCDNVDVESAQLAPVCDFYYTLGAGYIVSFNDLSGNEPTDWTWDFGDGSISLLQNPSHTYATSGSYTVCLTCSNGVGNDTECKAIEVPQTISESVILMKNIYPNPASDIIHLSFIPGTGNYNFELKNILGQAIDVSEILSGNHSGELILQVEKLPAGNYSVFIYFEDIVYTGQFIKE